MWSALIKRNGTMPARACDRDSHTGLVRHVVLWMPIIFWTRSQPDYSFFLLRLRLEPVSTTTIYCRLKRLVVLILSHAIIYGHVLMWSLRHFFHKIDTSLVSLFVVALLIPALVPTNIFVLNLMIWQLN